MGSSSRQITSEENVQGGYHAGDDDYRNNRNHGDDQHNWYDIHGCGGDVCAKPEACSDEESCKAIDEESGSHR